MHPCPPCPQEANAGLAPSLTRTTIKSSPSFRQGEYALVPSGCPQNAPIGRAHQFPQNRDRSARPITFLPSRTVQTANMMSSHRRLHRRLRRRRVRTGTSLRVIRQSPFDVLLIEDNNLTSCATNHSPPQSRRNFTMLRYSHYQAAHLNVRGTYASTWRRGVARVE
jgi:hypothetical protein